MKSMLVVFIDVQFTANPSLGPSGPDCLRGLLLSRLTAYIRNKWRDGNWVMHQDNAPAYTALQTRELLGQINTIVAQHPTCWLDLTPTELSI